MAAKPRSARRSRTRRPTRRGRIDLFPRLGLVHRNGLDPTDQPPRPQPCFVQLPRNSLDLKLWCLNLPPKASVILIAEAPNPQAQPEPEGNSHFTSCRCSFRQQVPPFSKGESFQYSAFTPFIDSSFCREASQGARSCRLAPLPHSNENPTQILILA